MSKYIVTPVHQSGYSAPFICVEVSPNKDEEKEKNQAIELAMQQSRLADFQEWRFVPKYNRQRKQKAAFKKLAA
jgi:hypothetical protein